MSFSIHLTENPATAQMNSGRCWMFAALNTFRTRAAKNLNVPEGFELSQNYTMFWDKFEKANYFLENILATLDESVGSSQVSTGFSPARYRTAASGTCSST